jgi:hypothetical protein
MATETDARSGPLFLFRKAVLSSPALQERLRSTGTCGELASIANEYLRSNVKLVVSAELERAPMRDVVRSVYEDFIHVSESDLASYLAANSNEKGEFLLGESELAMVAGGSTVIADTNECSYGSGCGSCTCSSSVVCVCGSKK